ncbi:DUF4178 domain-containing protein [Saccharopolyspora shandongensis]|uniref:DUF4178 domain-containing protein n=1 Tax=Saccharopolyspora shandongensis TaxID=418495 RepID=UPI0033DE3773
MNGLTATLIVVIIVLIVVVVFAVIMGVRAKRAAAKPETRPTDPFHTGDQDSLRGDPRALKAGDIVEVRGSSYTVRGTIRLSEGGWTWAEHLLDDAKGGQVWLAVEEDPDLILSLWTPVADAGEPGPKTIDFGGRTYHSEESGSAEFRSEATTGLAEQGTVRYHDYESSDGSMLGFESYGGADWEASSGEALSRYDVLIYPTAD